MGQEEATWLSTTKTRESRRTLAEDYFLEWKDIALDERKKENESEDSGRGLIPGVEGHSPG